MLQLILFLLFFIDYQLIALKEINLTSLFSSFLLEIINLSEDHRPFRTIISTVILEKIRLVVVRAEPNFVNRFYYAFILQELEIKVLYINI